MTCFCRASEPISPPRPFMPLSARSSVSSKLGMSPSCMRLMAALTCEPSPFVCEREIPVRPPPPGLPGVADDADLVALAERLDRLEAHCSPQ